jgi:beta-glucosidase
MVKYPRGFLWGTATSAYQLDGAPGTQWTRWTEDNAVELARTAARKFAGDPKFKYYAEAARRPKNYIAGAGIKHRTHYDDDFALLERLGHNAFRFGVEWARIEPTPGHFDALEIKFLKGYIAAMGAHGLEPIMTLWHWTMPEWFTRMGGFSHARNIKFFTRYAEFVLGSLKHDVKWVLTLNEPAGYAGASYATGEWPPNRTSIPSFFHVMTNLARAHNAVYRAAKKIKPSFKISLAHNTSYIHAGDDRLKTQLAVGLNRWARDTFFLRSVRKNLDFLGMNWYFSDTYLGSRIHNPNHPVSDMGWDMRPQDILYSLNYLWRTYHLPIMITENGLADARDRYRAWWLEETMNALDEATTDGIPLLGYLHWSAFDNFEWDKGWWPRFGLIEIDRKHGLRRKIRPSAEFYKSEIKKRS